MPEPCVPLGIQTLWFTPMTTWLPRRMLLQSATVLVVIGLLMHPYHCLCPTAVLGSGRRNTEPSRCMVFIDLIKKKNQTKPNQIVLRQLCRSTHIRTGCGAASPRDGDYPAPHFLLQTSPLPSPSAHSLCLHLLYVQYSGARRRSARGPCSMLVRALAGRSAEKQEWSRVLVSGQFK